MVTQKTDIYKNILKFIHLDNVVVDLLYHNKAVKAIGV